MDPFSKNRPKPTRTHRRCTFQNGYRVIPEALEILPGPKAYDGSHRIPHNINNHFSHLDRKSADPCVNANIYPKNLVYRRKNGDSYLLTRKDRQNAKTTPSLRIMPQAALYANMTLRYYGYYQETLPDGDTTYPEYGYRIRQVEVYYHMEDDTISVFEPYLQNSGLPQGITCPRRQYFWPGTDLTQPKAYYLTDFKLGNTYQIAHYNIYFYDADEFTKNYWKEHLPLDSFGRSEEPRVDPVWAKSQARREAFQSRDVKVKIEESATQHQKRYHSEIPSEQKLVFVGIIDDTLFPMARCRPVVVEYYLVDETIRVLEFRIDNDAHHFGSTMNSVVRRERIPKGLVQQNSQFSLGPFHKPYVEEFHNPSDFVIGNTLFLYGQKILLVECNEWTRKWAKTNLGLELQPNMEWRTKYQRRPKQTSTNVVVPNYTDYGTYNDSMKSVLEIDPQVRPSNQLPALCNSEDIIKFSAKLYSRHPDAHIPNYTILYHLADDTIAVFEDRVKGDASYGRKLIARQKCALPEYQSDPFQRTPSPTPHYDYRHLSPGNILTIRGTRFLLTVPDKDIYRVMDRHPLLFSSEQKELIDEAIEDTKVELSPIPPMLSDEELKSQVVPRVGRLLQRIKNWILDKPSSLMLLLSANDEDDLCIMTPSLLEDVCKAAKIDCDPHSAIEVLQRARVFHNRTGEDLLYLDEFIRYVFQHGRGLMECQSAETPRPPSPLLKFRLDLHSG